MDSPLALGLKGHDLAEQVGPDGVGELSAVTHLPPPLSKGLYSRGPPISMPQDHGVVHSTTRDIDIIGRGSMPLEPLVQENVVNSVTSHQLALPGE